MAKARITSKGQITVPKTIRDRLGVRPGDDLIFDVRGNRVIVTPQPRQGVAALAGLFHVKRTVRAEREQAWTAETRRLHRASRRVR